MNAAADTTLTIEGFERPLHEEHRPPDADPADGHPARQIEERPQPISVHDDLVQGARTAVRSPAWTWVASGMASRVTVPVTGAVMAASIFMASIVAMTSPAVTWAPVAT